MKKTLLYLSRTALIVGVLVALTPCGFCKTASTATKTACSMEKMAGAHDCCQSKKSRGPLCKIMDQSSIASVSKFTAPAERTVILTVASVRFSPAFVSAVPSTHVVPTSPPRGPVVLRI
jgi:hypothetical protein